MGITNLRSALVVDDEMIIRRLIAKALSEQGFECRTAVDGDEAERMLAEQHVDLLITDLKMPNKHGHALVSEVLKFDHRPIIVVHTGVLEPKLAADLFARGVDDVVYKPADSNLLAAKARALCDRRQVQPPREPEQRQPASRNPLTAACATPSPTAGETAISLIQLQERLANIAAVLPVSNAALDVYHMTRGGEWQLGQIAAAIQRDAALSAEVLRLANGPCYNPSSRRVVSLEQAVMAIGQKRIGEMAIAVNALSAVTPNAVPWLNLELAWKRSMAAGIALEMLIEAGGHQEHEEGLPLSATMYPLGRIVLGMMFPELYKNLTTQAWQSCQPLRDHERKALPMSHSATLAHLLTTWRIPADVTLPLRHASDDYGAIARLADPLRLKAELMKVAVLLGRLAVDCWESWDAIELPPALVLERLRVAHIEQFLAAIRSDVAKLAAFCPGRPAVTANCGASPPCRPAAYFNLSGIGNDFLAELLPSMGVQPVPAPLESLRSCSEPAIVNGLEALATRFAVYHGRGDALVISTRDKAEAFSKFARSIGLPCSYGALRDAALEVIDAPQSESALSVPRAEFNNVFQMG